MHDGNDIQEGPPPPGVGVPAPPPSLRISQSGRIPPNSPASDPLGNVACRCLSDAPRLDPRLINPERGLPDYHPGKKPDSNPWAIARAIILTLCFLAGFLGFLWISGCGSNPVREDGRYAQRAGGDVSRGK